MSHPIAIVFVDPWRCLTFAVAVALLLISVRNLWRQKTAAVLMARAEDQIADLLERAGLHDQATATRQRAQRWRRQAWPLRVPPAPAPGEAP